MQNENTSSDQPQEPITLERAVAAAISLHQSGQLDEAEAIYQMILEQFPNYPEALHFFGLLNHQKGNSTAAIALIEQALAQAPGYSDAYNNLGNIFNVTGEFKKAADNYRKALELNPGNVAAHNNLGIVLKDLTENEEAIKAFLKAIELMPDNAEFYRNLGNVYKRQCNFVDAAKAYRKALSLRAYNPEDYENLCVILYLQGLVEEAVPVIKQWLEHDPDNVLALHRLSSYTGQNLARASDEYVSQTFDGFADSFDQVLKGLEYKAPFLVLDAVKQIYGTASNLNMLDAGCGTGLCGPLLKSFAGKLIGVDLSLKMLERAAKRDCYHELVQAELTAFIGSHQSCFDAIVSADTLVYFGDLAAVCKAAAIALLQGGYFVFTVESIEEDNGTLEQGFKINPHGRFSHTESYLQSVLAASGLTVVKIENAVLRYEAGALVNGFLVVARLA